MACIDELDALRSLLGCIEAAGAQVSDVILEERNEAKLKKLTISELAPGMLLLATDEGRKRDRATACMSPLFKDDGAYDQNRACDAVLLRKADRAIALERHGFFKFTKKIVHVQQVKQPSCEPSRKRVYSRLLGDGNAWSGSQSDGETQ